jgi:nucleotide-binding universal stress UspA family protein
MMKLLSRGFVSSSAITIQRRLQSHILVGLSASSYGDLAIKQAVRMSKEGDKITGIFIPPSIDASIFPPLALQKFTEKRSQQIKDIIQRASKVASEAQSEFKSKAKFEAKELEPSENRRRAIVDACFSLKADVLVLGSLGAGAVKRGQQQQEVPFDEQKYQQNYNAVASIPDFAMHNAPCPVFVVKPKAA